MSDEQSNVNFGEDQYNAQEQYFDHRQYQYLNVAAAGRRCPDDADPPGCGGPLKKLEMVWQENNLKGEPLNERGRRARPPRSHPGAFTEEPPRPPSEQDRPRYPTEPIPPAPSPPQPNPTGKAMLKALPWGVLSLICAFGISDCSSYFTGTMPSTRFSPLSSALALLIAIGVFGLGTLHYKRQGQAEVMKAQQIAQQRYQHDMHMYRNRCSDVDNYMADARSGHEVRIARYRERKEAHAEQLKEHRAAMRVWNDAWVCTACGRGWHTAS